MPPLSVRDLLIAHAEKSPGYSIQPGLGDLLPAQIADPVRPRGNVRQCRLNLPELIGIPTLLLQQIVFRYVGNRFIAVIELN